MARQPDGPPPPPVVQRIRLRYAKRGRLRFTSHRDFARAFERALRRADLPMGYSAGFSPHPKISYLGAAPTGVASEAEYLEIGLAQRWDPERVRAAIDLCLPPGLDIDEAVEATVPGFAERIDASRWNLVLPGVTVEAAAAALATLLAAEEVLVERLTKSGRRTIDARAAIVTAVLTAQLPGADEPSSGAAQAAADGPSAELEIVVRQTVPAVRPDDVLAALTAVSGLAPPLPARVTRLEQGVLGADGRLSDPLAADRAAAAEALTERRELSHPVG